MTIFRETWLGSQLDDEHAYIPQYMYSINIFLQISMVFWTSNRFVYIKEYYQHRWLAWIQQLYIVRKLSA